jgi:protoheme IX farnesyltransferase
VGERGPSFDDLGEGRPVGWGESVTAYWQLTKPKVWALLVYTGIAGMLLGYKEADKPLSLLALTVGTAALVAGTAGANAITCYIDRDIDSVMNRTHGRPLPTHRIRPPWKALAFGLSLATLSLILSVWFNGLMLTFAFAGLVDNVLVYSVFLKRRSWWSILLGGISGGMPVLAGYAAITGEVSLVALFLSTLVMVWIPSHIWSLVIKYRGDYERARVPMLPVVYGNGVAVLCIAGATILLVLFASVVLFVAGAGLFLAIPAMALGAWILAYSLKLGLDRKEDTAWKLFKLSSPYLALVFALVVLGFSVP